MKILASVNHAQRTITVENSSPSAQSVQSSQFLSQNLLSALHVLKDTPGKITPALNARAITLETELHAVSVQRERNRHTIKLSANSLPLIYCQC